MSARGVLAWGALAVLGVVIAAAASIGASRIATPGIGLSSESPVAAALDVAPPEDRPGHRPARERAPRRDRARGRGTHRTAAARRATSGGSTGSGASASPSAPVTAAAPPQRTHGAPPARGGSSRSTPSRPSTAGDTNRSSEPQSPSGDDSRERPGAQADDGATGDD